MGELHRCSHRWHLAGNAASSRPWAFHPNLLLPSQEDGVDPVISLLSGNLPQWPLSSLPSPSKCPYIIVLTMWDTIRPDTGAGEKCPWKRPWETQGGQRIRNQGSSGDSGWEAENDPQNREQETVRPAWADGKGWPVQQSGADTVAAWGLSVWRAGGIRAQELGCWPLGKAWTFSGRPSLLCWSSLTYLML